jgi:hypothetical protein
VEIQQNHIDARSRTILLIVAIAAIALGCVAQPNVPGYSSKTSDPYQARRWSSPTFSPAHKSVGEAARHFINSKPAPVQPIDFPHKVHTLDIGVGCDDCHTGVNRGPVAGIPSINVCMSCHEDIGDEADSRIQALRDHAKRGEDMAWQRVYGFVEESHVRFNHAPHIRAQVACATCHGDVEQMTVAERVVEHTMGFCTSCHTEKKASNDCLVCHY